METVAARAAREVMDFDGLAEYLNISPQTARVWVSRRYCQELWMGFRPNG